MLSGIEVRNGPQGLRKAAKYLRAICLLIGFGATGAAQTGGHTTPTVVLAIGASSFTLANSPNASVQVSCNSACGLVDYQIDGTEWGTVPLTATGSYAANPFPTIAAGPHTLQVFYLGSPSYAAAASNSVSFTVLPNGTTVPLVVASLASTSFLLSSSPSASVQVSCSSACGLVDYRIDGAEWGTVALTANGSYAANPYPGLAAGPHTLQIFFLGNATYAATASNTVSFTVLPTGSTAPTVVASLGSTSFTLSNSPIASVQVGCNSACGLVDYTIDGNWWGTVPLTATGSFATNQFPTVAAGPHTFQVLYRGNASYAAATSSAINFTVLPNGSSLPTVVASLPSTIFPLDNSPAAAVQVNCNSACGLVDYRIDGNEWGTVALNASGSFAANPFPSLSAGAHTLQIFYLGNADYAPAASNMVGFTVVPNGSAVLITVAGLSTVIIGTPSVYKAAVVGDENQAVYWSVNKIEGGNATWGTIAGDGTYTPPANVPVPNAVVITATSTGATSSSGQWNVTIVEPIPVIWSASASTMDGGFTYLLNIPGTNFMADATVLINGQAVATTAVSQNDLQVTIVYPSIQALSVAVMVQNPNPGSTQSAPVNIMAVPPTATATAAARFLDQATFGPSAASIAHVQQIGLLAALAEQFRQPTTLFSEPPPAPLPQCNFSNYICTQSEFLNVTVWGSDQLRQRVAMALSEIWVAPILEDNEMPFYLNVLGNDAFTNYRTIMQDVTLSPNMGRYLNMVNSGKPPAGQIANENFAREMMQLFTIGLDVLNPDGTLQTDAQNNPIPAYTELQVEAFARAYTGWTFANADGSTASALNYTPNGQHFMVPVQSQHDTGQKILLNGTTLPAGQTAQQDLTGALDNIFANPNVGPFVCRQLIQHLVTSAPSAGYVQRVAAAFADNGLGVRGDMKAVLTAILLDPEARAGDAQTGDEAELTPAVNGGHLREPLLWTMNVLRGLNAVQPSASNPWPFVTFMGNIVGWTGEMPFSQASVFNYFSPQYVIPQTTMNAPEFEIESTSSLVSRFNLADVMIHNAAYAPVVDLSATGVFGQKASDPAALADYLSMIFMHSQMPSDMRSSLIGEIASIPAFDPQSRVEIAVYLVVTSPQYKVMN